jgi:hypothetical protein
LSGKLAGGITSNLGEVGAGIASGLDVMGSANSTEAAKIRARS